MTTIRLLIEHRADIQKADTIFNCTALCYELRSNRILGRSDRFWRYSWKDRKCPNPYSYSPTNTKYYRYDRLQILKLLIDNNATIDNPESIGWTHLTIASLINDTEMVLRLLEQNVTIDQPNRIGDTPLMIAVQGGYLGLVRSLTKMKASMVYENCGATPLNMAVRNGYLDIVKVLLENNASTKYLDSDHRTPLYLATSYGYPNIVKYLIETNGDVNEVSKDGDTLLYMASNFGFLNIVKVLLENNAYVHPKLQPKENYQLKRYTSFTPIMVATFKGHLEVVKLLFEKAI